MEQQTIECPDCQNPIEFTSQLLLRGAMFACTNCGVKIGLSQRSIPQVKNVMDKMDQLKNVHSSDVARLSDE